MDQPGEILATPSKSFFVDMLTRDIGVIDCVLDLADNAIDKAVELTGLDVMRMLLNKRKVPRVRGRRIDISLSAQEVMIVDTCGGMTAEEARTQVFLFGNPDERGAQHGLSVYGIGMKRAFFKLGRAIRLESQADGADPWAVDIDVVDWVEREDDWTLAFSGEDPERIAGAGTRIRISDLTDASRQRITDPTFPQELRARIASTYALFLLAGIEISVNGISVEAELPRFASETITPGRKLIRQGAVDILVIVGVAPRDDATPRGSYVFCNGRMVVEADKTPLTGWGAGLPAFHVGKYRRFVGYVYFRSEDVRLLPWRTTKQGVDPESPAFRAALIELRAQARPVIDFLNDAYPSDAIVDVVVEREVLSKATAVSIERLPREDAVFSWKRLPAAALEYVSIQYRRPRSQVDRVRRHIGIPRLSASRIGEQTFDFFVEQELD